MQNNAIRVETPEDLIGQAKIDGGPALGELFSRYTNYLTLLARVQVGRLLQKKLDPADLVQETFLQAHLHFPNFRGTSEASFTAWLRRILACVLANSVQHYLGTQARDPHLERALQGALDQSSADFSRNLAAPDTSPSEAAVKREQAVLLADALAKLPPDYREVVLLRFAEGLSFVQMAERMNRSVDSLQKLWLRGIARLRQIMGDE